MSGENHKMLRCSDSLGMRRVHASRGTRHRREEGSHLSVKWALPRDLGETYHTRVCREGIASKQPAFGLFSKTLGRDGLKVREIVKRSSAPNRSSAPRTAARPLDHTGFRKPFRANRERWVAIPALA